MAIELRKREHDVIAVTERPDLRGLADAELLAAAGLERRAVVTENVRDFAVIHIHYLGVGKTHFGIVFTHPRRFPRRLSESAPLLRALDTFLQERPADDALRNQIYWL